MLSSDSLSSTENVHLTSLIRHIADFVVDTRYDKLSDDAVEGAKKSILDTLGVILAAGGMEPAVCGVVDFAKESGGRAESSVLGTLWASQACSRAARPLCSTPSEATCEPCMRDSRRGVQ